MADITPIPDTVSNFWIGRQYHNSKFNNLLLQASIARQKPNFRYQLLTRYVTGVTDGQTWNNHAGICSVAFQANQTTDLGGVRMNNSSNVVMYAAAGTSGWIHCLINSGRRGSGGTSTMVPVTKGTAGYTQKGFIYKNHKADVPNTLTNNKAINTAGMDFRVIPFTTSSSSDRWRSQSLGLCPGIVSVAWQSNSPNTNQADRVAVTLDAAGDVIFTANAGSGDGWLWVWRKNF